MIEKHNHEYLLKCPYCGKDYIDDGTRTACDTCKKEGRKVILKYVSLNGSFIDKNAEGLSRYSSFLPGKVPIDTNKPLINTYKSKNFAKKYGFKNLYFTCTGINEDLGIEAVACSFKELEAVSVLHRLRSFSIDKPIIVSSAGNTARAFAYYAAKLKYKIIIIIPQISMKFLWLPFEKDLYQNAKKYVRLLIMKQPAKYLHAGLLAQNITSTLGEDVLGEGGFFNIGRISGLGCCALNFYDHTGLFPKHYVQAVGSGSGVLAAQRSYAMIDSEKSKCISYHLVQNFPYDPLVQAINKSNRFQSKDYYDFIDTVCSPMLTSNDPAYEYSGGIRDSIEKGIKCFGHSVKNNDIFYWHYEILNLENMQIALPAAAAVAGLIRAKENRLINPEDIIQVNITGTGENLIKNRKGCFFIGSCLESDIPEQSSYGGTLFEQWFAEAKEKIIAF